MQEVSSEGISKLTANSLWLDFEIKSLKNNELQIIGGEDLIYNYTIEFLFQDVTYMEIGMKWTWDKRLGKGIIYKSDSALYSESKRKFIQENFYVEGTNIYVFYGDENQKYSIIAKNMQIKIK